MKTYLKHFLWLYILVAVLLVAMLVVRGGKKEETSTGYTRTNTKCLTTERVFDYADRLTEAEENGLRLMIGQIENEIGCDIIFITCNGHEGDIRDWADDFYDENKFGYNAPWGDGALFVADFATGDAWFSTSGRVEEKYSENMIDSLLDVVCEELRTNTYQAGVNYVDRLAYDMSRNGASGIIELLKLPYTIAFSLIVTAFFLFVCLTGHGGKRTTTAETYVAGGHPNLRHKADIFLTKHVTSRRIETNSGGGGGHHISSGGHSHGGGGRHF